MFFFVFYNKEYGFEVADFKVLVYNEYRSLLFNIAKKAMINI